MTDIEAPAPASATAPSAPAQGTSDRGKSVPANVATSSSVPPANASMHEANANPLVGQFREPMDSTCSTYYTETTDGSIRPNENEVQRPLFLREIMVQMQQQHQSFVFWQKKKTGRLLTEVSFLRNYARLNCFYGDEQIARLWEALL